MMDNTVCFLRRRLFLPLLLPLLFVCGMCTTARAQITYLANESFKKSLPQGWSAYPASTPTAPTWASDTHVTASGKYAMHGYVPYNAGDTMELVTPFYDCSNYQYVMLKFSHICKVLGSDLCQIFYRENNLSSQWRPIPADAYKGDCKAYKANLAFDHSSYKEWQAKDTFAVPSAFWYMEEIFDLSDYAGYSTVAFKFVIKKGNYFGSFIADGWYLDDFRLLVSNTEMKLPKVSFVSTFNDVEYQTGPFEITAKVATRSTTPIIRPYLHYTAYNSNIMNQTDSVLMIDLDGGDSLWKATIPQFVYGTTISYWINGRDSQDNSSCKSGFFYLKNPHASSDTNSVAMHSIDNPKPGTLAGTQTVKVTIKNKGIGDLISAKIGWSVNGVLKTPVTWKGTLSCDMNDTVILGTYTQTLNGYDTIVCWVNTPNNRYDSFTEDDTLTVYAYGCKTLLGGSYTVGKGGSYDFQNLDEAMFNLTHCGIDGDVELRLASGTYDMALDFCGFAEYLGIHKLTITSMAKNADSVILSPSVKDVLTLGDSKHLLFEYLTLDADSARSRVIYFTSACSDVEFSYCHFKGYKCQSASTNYAVVYSPNAAVLDNIRFIGNQIEGGGYGIYLVGKNTTRNTNILFDSNYIENAYARPFYSSYTHIRFLHNTFQEVSGSSSFEGLYFQYASNSRIEANHIQTNGWASSQYGMQFYNCDTSTMVCNNEVVMLNNGSVTYGIYNTNSYGMEFVNNSVFMRGTALSQYGMYVNNANSSCRGGIHNNNVVADAKSTGVVYPLFISNASTVTNWQIDYNNWYAKGCMGYVGEEISSLGAFQAVVPTAWHESYLMPTFADTNDLRLRGNVKLICPTYPGVTTDKEGAFRFTLTRCGCYTGDLDSANGSLTVLMDWPKAYTYAGDTLRPRVVIRNAGLKNITSATIGWNVNGVKQPNVNWSGILRTGDADTIALGYFVCMPGDNRVVAFLSNLGALKDNITEDDTIDAFNYTCDHALNGRFSVGKTGDFKTLEEAMNVLQTCGMNGPVEFLMSDGHYNALSVQGVFPGSDSCNTVTFRSATGNRDSVVIKGVKAVQLQNSGYLLFKDISIEGGTIGVEMTGAFTDVTFHRCKIMAPAMSSTSYSAVSYSGQPKGRICFISNVIEGGYYGVSLSSTNGNQSLMLQNIGIVIDSNIISNASMGVYATNGCPILSVSHNQINATGTGISVLNYCNIKMIEGNRITISQPNGTGDGIVCGSYQNIGIDPTLIINNLIRIESSGIGTGINMSCGGQSRMDVHHNSIYVTSTAGNARGIYTYVATIQSGIFYDNRISRNLIVAQGTASYPLYITTQARLLNQQPMMVSIADTYTKRAWNNLYSTTNVAYINGAIASIANLNTNTQDTNSISEEESNGPFPCPGVAQVTRDINGMARDSDTYIGCYHLEPDSNDVALSKFTGVENITSATSTPVGVVVRNAGWNDLRDTVVITFMIDDVKQGVIRYVPAAPLALNQTDTVFLGNYRLPSGTHQFLAFAKMSKDSNAGNDTIAYSRYTCDSSMRGTYTIGLSKHADCSSMALFFDQLISCGVSGDIVMAFESGKYTGLMDLSVLSTTMGNYHLTVTSKAGNRDSVVISNATGLVNVGEKNKHITIRDLTLQLTAMSGNLIKLSMGCQYIDVLRNNLIADSLSSAYGVFYQNPLVFQMSDNIRVSGNKFYGGNYGVYMYGPPTTTGTLLYSMVDSNDFRCQHSAAIYIYNCEITSVSHNRIWHGRNNSTWYGIYCSSLHVDSVVGNYISDAYAADDQSYGMYFHNCLGAPGIRCFVANNAVNLRTALTGVYDNSSEIDFYNNTILVEGSAGRGYYGLHTGVSADLKGNLFIADKGQYAFVTSGTNYTADYNNYYTYGVNYVIVNNQEVSDLTSLKVATPGDNVNSVCVEPVFVNLSQNLRIRSNNAFYMPSFVSADIMGKPRSNITNMGAYQALGVKTDAMLNDFTDTKLTGNGTLAVQVTMSNMGEDTLKTVTIGWTANGVAQPPVKWTGRLTSGEKTSVALGSCNSTTGTFIRITAWLYNPNNGTDSDPSNDTANYYDYLCKGRLAGDYTVGGSQPDFQSVEEALKALHACGVSAPVVMRIRSGNYGQWSMNDSISGTSDTNTITFTADGTAIPVFEKGLVFRNISHVRFHKLTFGNITGNQCGVQMHGSCTDVVIRDCNIYSDTTIINPKFDAFRFYNGGYSHPTDIRLTGNHIVGGNKNIHLYYMAGNESVIFMKSSSMYIDSNVLEGAYMAGLYLDHYSSVRSFCHNTVRNRYTKDTNMFYGLYSYNCANFEIIEGNRIFVHGNNAGYGMYFNKWQNHPSYSDGYALIANNEIRMLGYEAKCGMFVGGVANRLNIHHNSIYSRSENAKAFAMWLEQNSASNNYMTNVTRNLLVSDGVTGANNYPLYLAIDDIAAYRQSNGLREWNGLYSLSTPIVGYVNGASQTSIAVFQGFTGNDGNCVNAQPSFAHLNVGLELVDYSLFSCPTDTLVTTDIYGNPRGVSTVMGCYGAKMWDGINLLVDRIVSPVAITNVTCYDDSIPVEIALKNMGRSAACFDSTSLRIDLDVNGAINFHFDTVFTSGTMIPAQTVTIPLTSIPVMNSGKYHIKVKLAYKGDVLPDDDTISMVYNASRVVVPYDETFSTAPDELLNVRNSGSVDWSVVHDNAMPSSYGTGRLEFAGAGNPGASASAVFNAVDIRGCVNPTLSFWYAHGVSSGIRDVLYVFATTDGGASYTTIGRITPNDTSTGWQQYDIDLGRFAGEPCLSIVFQAISFGGADQSIDRIRISADADAAITLLPVELGTLTACNNDAVPLRAVITNQTALPFAYSSDTVTAEVTGATTQSFSYVYNKQLAGYETDTVTLGNMDLRANGNYYINVSMQSQDDNAQNDTASDSTILIRQDIAMDSIIGIDAQTQHLGGDTVYVSALVRNNCNMAVDRFTVTMELNGETVITDTVLRHMEAGDSIVHAVSMPYVVPFGTKEQPYYFLEVSTDISCDGDANNDSRSLVGIIDVPDSIDLQVLSIAQPTTDSGHVKVSPKVTVANIGNAEVQNVMLHVDVLDSAMTLLETVSEYINFINTNDTLEYAFSLTYTVPNYDGSYYLKAYTDTYTNEINTANDTLTAMFACIRNTTGIANHTATNWSVGQNEPNPANATTVIPFVIPEDAEVALTIMGVNGQLLHREIVAATAGANRVTLHTGTLSSGLYYYGVEYKGQRIVRKMNVVR